MGLFDRLTAVMRRVSGVDVAKAPDYDFAAEAAALIAEGNTLEDTGYLIQARVFYERAVQIAPTVAKTHLNLGNALLALGQPDEAIQAYLTAILRQPDFAAAHFNIGNAQVICKRPQAALLAYEQALLLNPEFVDALVAYGNVQGDLGNTKFAITCYERALLIEPNYAEVHNNLGATLRLDGCLSEAMASFKNAIALKPNFVGAYCDLANVYRELGDIDNAIRTARAAQEIDQNSVNAFSLLLFCLSHSQNANKTVLIAEHRRFGELFEPPLKLRWLPNVNLRDPDRNLRLGFVSADLSNHAVANFFGPVLEFLLKMSSLTVHIYNNSSQEDAGSRQFKSISRSWVDVAAFSDDALANLIRDDGIDVLIDLSGHTAGNRLMVFAQKPAPIQMSWIGYPGTTGLQSVDYYIGDHHFLPPDEFDNLFTEKILRIPVNAPFQSISNPPEVNALPALKNGYITFSSFNRLDKISRDVIVLWSQLLVALPGSRMLLGGLPLTGTFEEITEWFSHEGVVKDRLIFHRRSIMDAYLQLHHHVDICLDTFPYGGGTTTCHAMWMGVPTLTLVGSTPAGRAGYSILSHLGLQDIFSAKDRMEFVSKGKWCAGNLEYLAELRLNMRNLFQASALSQPRLVAKGLEFALRHAWKKWCADLSPTAFEVVEDDGKFFILNQPEPFH